MNILTYDIWGTYVYIPSRIGRLHVCLDNSDNA